VGVPARFSACLEACIVCLLLSFIASLNTVV
jgi:hypothetical protein